MILVVLGVRLAKSVTHVIKFSLCHQGADQMAHVRGTCVGVAGGVATPSQEFSDDDLAALGRRRCDCVRLLVEHGANVDEKDFNGKTALDYSMQVLCSYEVSGFYLRTIWNSRHELNSPQAEGLAVSCW